MGTRQTAAAALLLLGCGAPAAMPDMGGGCSVSTGLDPDQCLLPWPSSAFLVEDSSTRTGYRVSIPQDAMPSTDNGTPVDPAPWNRWDGFTPMTTLLAEFPSVIDPATLPTWHDPG